MSSRIYHDRIQAKLQAAVAPALLRITDQSALHAGHAGHDPEGETHFKVVIVSDHFTGMPKIARHRLVYQTLAMELDERVHALSLELWAPDEYNHR